MVSTAVKDKPVFLCTSAFVYNAGRFIAVDSIVSNNLCEKHLQYISYKSYKTKRLVYNTGAATTHV